ncbi:hypothetical protein [Ornithinimicrobium cavernae]|uniref:hypothetical protein n=1 Tax=Ornithinimicrobium cavernae TaxID=2666047 RepID=UPI000D68EE22|nr:hypothetical protein [Ornithinimicrobium cavernae]
MQQSQLVARQHEAHTYLVRRVGLPTGPQVVLVHGIGVASTYFARLAHALSRPPAFTSSSCPASGVPPSHRSR